VRKTGVGGLTGSAPPELVLAVGPGGQPITWVPDSDNGNQAATAPFSGTTGMVSATVGGLSPGVSHVMILNKGGGGVAAVGITFETSCSQPGGVCATPDLGDDGGTPTDEKGCSCDVGAPTRLGLLPLLAIALLALALRRRRI
jgi:MYXO-CTERM domain-containing protein